MAFHLLMREAPVAKATAGLMRSENAAEANNSEEKLAALFRPR
jgi:hypothetical protein